MYKPRNKNRFLPVFKKKKYFDRIRVVKAFNVSGKPPIKGDSYYYRASNLKSLIPPFQLMFI
jgi:hypothetical protein